MLKKSYRTVCLAGLLAAGAMGLAACGNDYGPSVQSPQAETTTSPPGGPATTMPEAGPAAPRVAAEPSPKETVQPGAATTPSPATPPQVPAAR